jgi:biotin transport system substrate-specific component
LPSLTTRELTYATLFTALIAGGALVAIPVGSVPFTLQVLFVLLAGMLLGPRLAALSVLAYLALGLVAPVYAGGTSGLGVLFGPTGGYLWGFVLAALVTGAVSAHGRVSLARFVGAGLLGVAPIYALGALWLAAQLHIGMGTALATGVAPFVWLDVLKAVVAGLAARSLVSLPLGLPSPQRGR